MVSVFSSQQTCIDHLFEKIKSSFPLSFHASSNASVSLFHNRIGHPSKHVVQTLLSNNCITFTGDNKQKLEFCNACQLGKLHQFHFSATDIKLKYPLELIHTDLWGPTSVLSMEGYRYYISFVDDYTRYCWIFPIVLKSDVLGTFKNFKTLVETSSVYLSKLYNLTWGESSRPLFLFFTKRVSNLGTAVLTHIIKMV